MSARWLAFAILAIGPNAPALLACEADGGRYPASGAPVVVQELSAAGPTETDELQKNRRKRKFYVAPDGRPDGNGTIDRPWDLQTALNQPTKVKPGSVILLRGGTYVGKFVSQLNGTATQRITVRQYQGERATIDAGMELLSDFEIHGSYTTYWGFEVMASNPNRTRNIPDGNGYRGEGVNVYGANIKLVNLVIHDTEDGIGLWEQATDAEVYGCIIYNNGFLSTLRGNGHGIYIQNHTGQKQIRDVVSFNNFSTGMKAYGQSGYAQNVWFEGVASFNNGSLEARGASTREPNLFVGTTTNPADQITITNCYLYQPPDTGAGGMRLGYVASPNGHAEVTNCYLADAGEGLNIDQWNSGLVTGNTIFATGSGQTGSNATLAGVHTPNNAPPAGYTWNNNTYYDTTPAQDNVTYPFSYNNALNTLGGGRLAWSDWRAATGFDSMSSYHVGLPTGARVFVRPNAWEPGRAHVIVYNWDHTATVGVDVSGVLQVGQSFEVRNVQNYYGPVVLSGVYNGGSLQLPMTGLTVATAYGNDFTPPSTAPEFNVFVVIPH